MFTTVNLFKCGKKRLFLLFSLLSAWGCDCEPNASTLRSVTTRFCGLCVVLLAVSDHQGFWFFEYQISVYSLKYELGGGKVLSFFRTRLRCIIMKQKVLPPHVWE